MTVLQINVPEKKEKAVRILLKEMGVTVKKIGQQKLPANNLKTAVKELNDIKSGKIKAGNFDDLINEL